MVFLHFIKKLFWCLQVYSKFQHIDQVSFVECNDPITSSGNSKFNQH